MSNTFDKLSILDSFIEEVNSYLPEIEANLERLAQSPSGTTPVDMDAIEETYRRAHTIGGSASMRDFPGLAQVANGMEDILRDVLDGLTPLDAPTLGLLQRSLGRLHQLVRGIHGGVDQDGIIAEDDADYVHYRALIDASAQQPVNQGTSNGHMQPPPAPLPTEVPSSPASMPSLDEVLASFRTPAVAAGEEVDWPEEPVPDSSFETTSNQHAQLETLPAPEPVSSSALEMLAASIRPSFAQNDPPATPAPDIAFEDEKEVHPQVAMPTSSDGASSPVVVQDAAEKAAQELPLPVVYSELQEEAQSLEEQASSLKEMLNQLRIVMSVIEAQRSEFKGFLDGSKDALDRMEDWAGQAMGLNLRNSPEHVRRYLPLSVMWVSNSKLKKVLDLLKQITSGVEMTDEQIHIVLRQLTASIESCGEVFQHLQLQANTAGPFLKQEPGWSPWEMHTTREADGVHERVTFERRGDSAAIRDEIEAAVREDLRREYEITARE